MTLDFEQKYSAVRKKENRIYTDVEVASLPEIYSHEHSDEWKLRRRSSRALVAYLCKKNIPLRILELGCGNGWLASQLSNIRNSEVTGLDINYEELIQAQRVFKKDNLSFAYGELNSEISTESEFDSIVFAASIQYFPSLSAIIPKCLQLLSNDGEVHIIDSYFYTTKEQKHAKVRTSNYYSSIGFPEMAESYFHHTYDELKEYNFRIVPQHSGIINSLIKRVKPFDWVIIRK